MKIDLSLLYRNHQKVIFIISHWRQKFHEKKLLPLLSFFFILCVLCPTLTVNAATYNIDFETKSKGIQLINLDTDTVVYEKNADMKLEPASCTKIMTFIIAVENIDDLNGTKITAKKEVLNLLKDTQSSTAGVLEGETLTAMQLLYCLMVPSGNDASVVLADYVGNGDQQKFVDMMNAKAQELGLKNTHFMNPHGLHNENHYTTAADLAVITKYAMNLPHFTEISSTVSYKLPATNVYPKERLIRTTNKMINSNSEGGYYYQYAKGIKTGSHDQAGYCLVSTAIKNGYSYLCVALGAPSVDANGKTITEHEEMRDSKKLYQWAFSELELKSIISSDETVTDIPLAYAWDQDSLLLTAEKSFSTILPADVSVNSILVEYNLPEKVEAPIKKGDVIGTATYTYANQELTTVNLVASESVERSELLHSLDVVKNIVTSVWFIVIFSIIIVLLIVYLILAIVYNKKKKKMRKVKKYRDM